MLIIFSGIDGSGKSTQIKLLKNSLLSKEKVVETLWARGGYTKGFESVKRALRRFLGNRLPEPGKTKIREQKMSNPFIVYIWLSFSIIDLIFFWGLYVRLKLILGRYVICDRYIMDTYVDFKINFPTANFEKMILWRLLSYIVPKEKNAFLLYINVEESVRRSKLKQEPFPDTKETLIIRSAYYLDKDLFSENDYLILNCNESIISIHNKIIKYLD